jgi:hypothetical protein
MAILLSRKTVCPLCGRIIADGEKAIGFPPFVANEVDPLYIFSDGVFHASCFRQDPLAKQAEARYSESRKRTSPLARQCRICGRVIDSPDEYLGLGHLTDDPSEPVHAMNYAQFHRACLDQMS